MYYIRFLYSSINNNLSDYNYTYTYGDSYIDNEDGTYTIKNENGSPPETINRSDWYSGYSNVGANKYVCKNATNSTCSDLWYTTSTNNTTMTYIRVINIKYAKEFEYKLDPEDNIYKYFLDDDTSVSFWNIYDNTNYNSLNNAHYTCWNTSGKCTKISYIYGVSGDKNFHYIDISDGKSIEDAKNEMLYNNDVNTKNSTIKTGIDAWYKKYILKDFDNYIEDIIYCDNRIQATINYTKDGWVPNGGNIVSPFYFPRGSTNLQCTYDTDKFSVQNSIAKLTYKVGLATSAEMYLLGNSSIKKNGQYYWLLSPSQFFGTSPSFYNVNSNGEMSNSASGRYGVRPVISLIPGIEYVDGDGSMEHPYRVDDGTNQ
jgi:hypothetical protein